MTATPFGLVGSGWRSEFFLRIARALPDQFTVAGLVTRDAERGRLLEARWGVPTFRTPEPLGTEVESAFAVVSVPAAAATEIVTTLAARGVPVLAETPAGADLDALLALWRLVERGAMIQVAEQYIYQPAHAARLSLVRSGVLGEVSEAQASVAHGYHGVSLLRHFLGAGFARPHISARLFTAPLVAGPDRAGPPGAHVVGPSRQVIAHCDFGDRLGIHDFAGGQYFSWIRSPRVLIRGERGEIKDNEVRFLTDFATPVKLGLVRVDTGQDGNLEGHALRGILAGREWVYTSPFPDARLSDEEVAVATVLRRMAEHVAGGPPVYCFADAAQDQYLALAIEEAAATGTVVTPARQPWMDPAT